MGAQRLGAKKVRQLERRFRLKLDAVWSFGDQHWVHARTVAHRHVDLDRRTGVRRFYRDDEVGFGKEVAHFDSCPDAAETERLRGGQPAWMVDVLDPDPPRRPVRVGEAAGMGRPAGELTSGDPRSISYIGRDKVSRYL